MLNVLILSIIVATCFSSSHARASGFEETELLKYLENLRSGSNISDLPAIIGPGQSGISNIISLLDEDEPALDVLEEEIKKIEISVLSNERHFLLTRYAMGVAYQKSRQYQKAADLALHMLQEKISSDWQYAFYEMYFWAAWETEDIGSIVKIFPQYTRIFGIARRNEKIAVIAYQAFERTGKQKEAVEVLEELVRGYPGSEHSRYAFAQLVDRSCDDDAFFRYVFSKKMLILLSRNNDLNNGIRDFVLANIDQRMTMDDGAVRTLNAVEKTDFLFKTRMYDEALAMLRQQYELRRGDPNDPELPELMHGLARTLMRVQDYKRSAMFASKFLSQYADHSLRSNMKEILADSLRYLNVSGTASALYKELASVSKTDHFYWQTFWTLYIGRRYQEALNVLILPETKTATARISDDGVLYWEAVLLGKLGQEKLSSRKFTELMNKFPNSFYASYRQLKGTMDAEAVVINKLPELKTTPNGVVLANFSENSVAEASHPLGPNRLAEVVTFAEDLSVRGRSDLARLYLSEVDSGAVTDWPTYKGLADISFKLGLFKPTKLIRYKKFSPLRDIPDDWRGYKSHIRNNEKHWKVYFPNAYSNVVGPVAEVFNRSKYLILSIMRAESFYNNEARSPVGAVGLMQMMPYTAIKIANLVKDFDFQMSELTKPEVSIGYGAYYIDKLHRYYQENPILAVAAYNAGPQAVNQWIESCRGCSMDEFVESIPYKETRNYVKKVISYFFNYFRVYNAGVPNIQNLNLPDYIPDSSEIF